MDLIADLHTHTIASRHAYSTLLENAAYAAKAQLLVLGISDHAPGMPETTSRSYFFNVKVWPRELFGIQILRGAEANILDRSGEIDLSDEVLERLDYVIASIHQGMFPSELGEEANTDAAIAAMAHSKVCAIGHPDDGRFPMDYGRLAKAAKFHNKALELNESSLSPLTSRVNGERNAMDMLEACKRESAWVIVSSDSHIAISIGFFSRAKYLLEKCAFPARLVVNSSARRLNEFFRRSISLDMNYKGM
ncbi:MAG: phosphatase [Clostridiales bacterium]|nr:phosphatase [Clostridiales bacterium]